MNNTLDKFIIILQNIIPLYFKPVRHSSPQLPWSCSQLAWRRTSLSQWQVVLVACPFLGLCNNPAHKIHKRTSGTWGHNTWFDLLYNTLVTPVWFHSTTVIIGEAGSRLVGPFVHDEWIGKWHKVPHTFKLQTRCKWLVSSMPQPLSLHAHWRRWQVVPKVIYERVKSLAHIYSYTNISHFHSKREHC